MTLLRQRCFNLESEITQARSLLKLEEQRGLKRLFMIESEYQLAMREAELVWTRALLDEMKAGKLGDLDEWAAIHHAMEEQGREAAQPEGVESEKE
jgi:hypothetical protein